MAIKGIKYALNRYGVRVPKLVVHPVTTAPVDAPFHIAPTTAPTGTLVAGDFYVDSTTNRLMMSNGTTATGVGNRRIVKTAAATLTAAESGAACVFSTAAGYTYTLPTAAAGLYFEFIVGVTITSVAAKIITKSASEFMVGTFEQSTDGTYTTAVHIANGTTHVSWNGNGSTTGGLGNDRIHCLGLSATQWQVWGSGRATGAEATPFATS